MRITAGAFSKIKIIIFILLFSMSAFAQNSRVDSLVALLKKDKADTTKITHLNNLGRELMYSNPDTAIILGNQALQLCNDPNLEIFENIESLKANSIGNLGVYYYFKGDYPKALEYYLKALKIDEELNNKEGVVKRLGNIGNIYNSQADYPKALEYYFKALKIGEEIGYKQSQANNLSNIGLVYTSQSDYPKALDYYFKSLKIAEELGNKQLQAINLGNIAIVYHNHGDYPKALDYYFRSLKIAEELGDKNRIAIQLGNIGSVYSDEAEHTSEPSYREELNKKALNNYFNASKINREIGNEGNMSANLGNIGSLYTTQKKYKSAYDYIYRALAISDSIGEMNVAKDHYGYLSELYEKSNIQLADTIGGKLLSMEQMRSRAMYYYKRSVAIRDTLFSQENRKQLVQKEMNFEFDKREALTKAEYDAENKKKKIVLWSVIGGLLLVAVFSVFMFNRWRVTQKQKKIIEVQKQEADEQKKLIEDKNKDITDSIQYASRIQQALLTSKRYIGIALTRKFFPTVDENPAYDKFFILFKPKDIVSGDFYWAHNSRGVSKKEGDYNNLFFACCDCTGHGVPGAFMSLLNISFLNEAVIEKRIYDTSKILDDVRQSLIKSLSAEPNEERKDGMDSVLFKIDFNNNMLYASCANNSILIIRNAETVELEPDKMPVGNHPNMHKPFTQHEFQLKEGDLIFAYTDGFADQFGGPKGKKFKYKPLNEKLASISAQPLAEQKTILEKTFEDWKGSLEQVDDVLVIGIKV